MRAYLMRNRQTLRLDTLIMFAYQLSTALSYLESKKFVHRSVLNNISVNNKYMNSCAGILYRVKGTILWKEFNGKI